MDDINTLRRILRESRVIAVVGLSADWYRPSYFAAKYMQEHGYRVVPVNPRYGEILGEKCYPSLREVPGKVDLADYKFGAMKNEIFVTTALLSATLAGGAFAAATTGTIKAIDKAKDSIILANGAVFTLPEGIEAESLKAGEKVMVTYTTTKAGIHKVSSIHAIK